ncbi:hypothetical protein CF336_g9254 [Tilletia laevis]|nr:hypothetical protein CF336_g9254 [Tilletia laevis]
MDDNSAPGAAPQLQSRAGSAPPDGDAENARRLEELAESNPPAANLARVLITAGHSIPAAIQMVMAAVAPAAPPVEGQGTPNGGSAPGSPDRARIVAVGTPRRQEGDVANIRGGSVPPPSPSLARQRRVREELSPSPSAKRQKAATGDDADAKALADFEPNPTYLNPHEVDEVWPAERICKQVKRLEFIWIWHFTPAGCRQAEEQRADGTDEAMVMQSDGSFKPAVSTRVTKDELLPAHQFQAAAALWLRVATRMKVPSDILCAMTLLNTKIFGHPHWQTDPATLQVWHAHQRRSWATYMANPEVEKPFSLHALNPSTYSSLQLRGAVHAAQSAERRAQRAEALVAALTSSIKSQSSKVRDPPATFFRQAGGAGPSTFNIRGSASSGRHSYSKACLRCGGAATADQQVNKCMPAQRTDGSLPILEIDPGWRNVIRFQDTRERACIPFNLPGGCRGDCKGNAHRCTWCGSHGHSHQDCSQAPHRR